MGPSIVLFWLIDLIFWANDFFRCKPSPLFISLGDLGRSFVDPDFCTAALDAGVPSRKVDVPKPGVSSPWIIPAVFFGSKAPIALVDPSSLGAEGRLPEAVKSLKASGSLFPKTWE